MLEEAPIKSQKAESLGFAKALLQGLGLQRRKPEESTDEILPQLSSAMFCRWIQLSGGLCVLTGKRSESLGLRYETVISMRYCLGRGIC